MFCGGSYDEKDVLKKSEDGEAIKYPFYGKEV